MQFLRHLVLGGALALALLRTAAAAPLPTDPVVRLQQALQDAPIPDRGAITTTDAAERRRQTEERDRAIAERQKLLRDRAQELRTVNELRRGLTLNEWVNDEIDVAVRQSLADRFTAEVRQALQGTPATQLAALRMLGELDATSKDQKVQQLSALVARNLSADVARLLAPGGDGIQAPAARVLGRMHADPAVTIKALRQLLQSGQESDRLAAAEGLGNLVKTAFTLTAQNISGDEAEVYRRDLAKVLTAVLPVAAGQMAEASPAVRRLLADVLHQAATALNSQIREVQTRKDILADLERTRREVREERNFIKTLMPAFETVPATLVQALQDPDPEVRLLAAQTAQQLGLARQRLERRARSVNLVIIRDEGRLDANLASDPDTQVVTLAQVPPAPAKEQLLANLEVIVPTLAATLKDPAVRTRLAAISALETLGEAARPAAPALIQALADKDRFVRWAAARTLGKLAPPAVAEAVPGLAKLLADADLDVRLTASTALERFGPAAAPAVPALIHNLQATDAEARLAAIKTLQAIGTGSAPAIPALAAAVTRDTDSRVRRAAAELLGLFGPSAAESVPALQGALRDNTPEVRQAVADAILSITRAAGGK